MSAARELASLTLVVAMTGCAAPRAPGPVAPPVPAQAGLVHLAPPRAGAGLAPAITRALTEALTRDLAARGWRFVADGAATAGDAPAGDAPGPGSHRDAGPWDTELVLTATRASVRTLGDRVVARLSVEATLVAPRDRVLARADADVALTGDVMDAHLVLDRMDDALDAVRRRALDVAASRVGEALAARLAAATSPGAVTRSHAIERAAAAPGPHLGAWAPVEIEIVTSPASFVEDGFVEDGFVEDGFVEDRAVTPTVSVRRPSGARLAEAWLAEPPGTFRAVVHVPPDTTTGELVLDAVVQAPGAAPTTGRVDLARTIVDSEPPEAPTALRVEPTAGGANLAWEAGPGEPAGRYRVYASEGLPLDLALRAEDRTATYALAPSDRYVTVVAVDAAGNPSPPSALVAIPAGAFEVDRAADAETAVDRTFASARAPAQVVELMPRRGGFRGPDPDLERARLTIAWHEGDGVTWREDVALLDVHGAAAHAERGEGDAVVLSVVMLGTGGQSARVTGGGLTWPLDEVRPGAYAGVLELPAATLARATGDLTVVLEDAGGAWVERSLTLDAPATDAR